MFGFIVFVFIVLVFVGIYAMITDSQKLNDAYKSGDPEKIKIAQMKSDYLHYGKGYNIKCPNCGRVNVNHISTANRAASVAMLGLASSKIGKTFECPNCKYKW